MALIALKNSLIVPRRKCGEGGGGDFCHEHMNIICKLTVLYPCRARIANIVIQPGCMNLALELFECMDVCFYAFVNDRCSVFVYVFIVTVKVVAILSFFKKIYVVLCVLCISLHASRCTM